MRTTSKNYPDWVEDLPDDKAQPWGVYNQHPFVSIRQHDGGDPDTVHWVLVPVDEVEEFIKEVRATAQAIKEKQA